MCGIAGFLELGAGRPPPPLEPLTAMVSALEHRGPDEFGYYRDERVALGHARLSIIDLAAGQQPLSNEDGTLWVVFNGEIFNHVELREELVGLGHVFKTRSDTEVIVHAFESWGDAAFERFNGQFAVALWDSVKKRLVLARDPLGVRPLYLCEHGGRLCFASEVKALFAAFPSIPRELDPVGLAETFTFWTVVPPQSIFKGITELEPGHVRAVGPDGDAERCFWRPTFPTSPEEAFQGTLEEAVLRVRQALLEAVSLRMLRSDVPVGSYLSGGLDSSLVASLGRQVKGESFKTFSLRFEDAEYDETAYQRSVVERIGSDHQELVVRRQDIAAIFPEVVFHAERPLLRTAPSPLFLLSRLVRSAGVKVVLTGEGADEMFAGYDLFREGKVRRFWGRRPNSPLRPRLLERLYPWLARSPVSQRALAREFFGRGLEGFRAPGFAHRPRWDSTTSVQRLFNPDLRAELSRKDVVARLLEGLPKDFARWTSLAQDQYLEQRTLLSGYLLSSQGDRMLMANSVEGRFPFLDANVVALANSLPTDFKLHGLDEKHVLKRAAEGLLPDAVARRPKQPYRAPDASAFTSKDAPGWVAEVLSEEAVKASGLFDPRSVEKLWAKCRAHDPQTPFSNTDNMALVGVLSTQLLHKDFIERPPRPGRAVVFKTRVDRVPPGGAT